MTEHIKWYWVLVLLGVAILGTSLADRDNRPGRDRVNSGMERGLPTRPRFEPIPRDRDREHEHDKD